MTNDHGMDFATLDLGSNAPISVPMATIEVEVTSQDMVKDYADSFVKEANRVSPELNAQVGLTAKEMEDYAQYLLIQRIAYVDGNCPEWRHLKTLYIPVFLQFALRMIGVVVIRDRGLTLRPVIEEKTEMTWEQAHAISEKVGSFEGRLQIVLDAMPREDTGDESVMSTALIAGYVRSMRKVDHVADTYVSAFLGMKLHEEQAFSVLYRVQYDDIDFIRTALTQNRKLL